MGKSKYINMTKQKINYIIHIQRDVQVLDFQNQLTKKKRNFLSEMSKNF
jgi:hypothetical protein